MQTLEPLLKDKTHVIWDWNGTLLADLDHAVATVNVMLTENNLPLVDLLRYRETFGFPVVDYYHRLGFSREPQAFAKLCERFNELFYGGLGSCSLWPGARELLGKIKSMGKVQSVLSASEHSMLLQSLDHFELRHHFDHVFGIYDKAAASKVERGLELMKTAAAVAGRTISPETTVLIGDTDHDLEVGKAMGVDVILVEHGHQTAERLRAVHHQVVKVF
jgi:phosphoglycolate phosphatase